MNIGIINAKFWCICYFTILANFYVCYSQNQNNAEKYAVLAQADSYFKTNNYKSAFAKYQLAQDLFEKNNTNDDEKYFYIINQIGLINYYNSNYIEAKIILENAINLQNIERCRKTKIYGRILNNLASAHSEIGNYQIAKNYYIQSIDFNQSKKEVNKFEHSLFLNNLADLYMDNGSYSEAEPLYKQCLEILESINERNTLSYSKIVNNLGELYLKIGFYDLALVYLHKSLDFKHKLEQKDIASEVITMINIASANFYTDNLEVSEEIFLKALKLKSEISSIESIEYANILLNYAELVQKKGFNIKYLNLIEYCDKIFAKNIENYSFNRDYLSNKTNLAYAKYLNKDITSAKIIFEELKIFFESNKLTESLEYSFYLAKYIEFAININQIDLIPDRMFYQAYQTKKNEILNNFPKLTEKERLNYYDKNESYFNNIKRFCIYKLQNKKPNKIDNISSFAGVLFDFEMNQKGFVLNSLSATKLQLKELKDSTNIRLYNQIEEQKIIFSKIYQRGLTDVKNKNILNDLIFKINELEKKLLIKINISAENLNKKSNWREIQNSLSESQAVVDIVRVRISKDSILYCALILQKKDIYPSVVVLDNSKEIENRYIKYYRNSLKNQMEDIESYNIFWKPIEEKLNKEVKTVYFCNDGSYNQLNIATLLNPKTKKYAIENYRIDYITNPSEVLKINTALSQKKDFVNTFYLFGRPSYNLESNYSGNESERDANRAAASSAKIPFSDLPETEAEINKINELLKNSKKNTNVFIKEYATEENFNKISAKSIVHIATHGYFVPSKISGNHTKEPLLRSGLVLADVNMTKKDDGLLTAYELNQKNLNNIDLLVLSACETGLGDIKNGEGVFGLQRALISAGAKSLIMSLWTVNDNSTKELMIEFYKYYLISNNKRESLHNAQLNTMKKFNHPYYWGAFVYTGQ